MKVYVAGKISGLRNYADIFREAEEDLKDVGYIVLNPCIMPEGFTYDEYMHVCYAMIDICECVFLIDNWVDSRGAMMELEYAIAKGKTILAKKRGESEVKALYRGYKISAVEDGEDIKSYRVERESDEEVLTEGSVDWKESVAEMVSFLREIVNEELGLKESGG